MAQTISCDTKPNREAPWPAGQHIAAPTPCRGPDGEGLEPAARNPFFIARQHHPRLEQQTCPQSRTCRILLPVCPVGLAGNVLWPVFLVAPAAASEQSQRVTPSEPGFLMASPLAPSATWYCRRTPPRLQEFEN